MNRKGEVATLFTIAALAVMAVGTFLGGQRAIQSTILKLGGFAYDKTYRAHFYTGPTFEEKDMVIDNGVVNPNVGYVLVRGSLCYTGATIPSQTGRFWVHTPKDPNIPYRGDPKYMIYEGKTVEYISSQVSRPYCDSPDVGKKNWKAWDFTLKLNKPFSKALCEGLFVTASTSFVYRDEIEMDKNAWFDLLRRHGVNCSPTEGPTNTPTPTGSRPPTITNTPTPSLTATPTPRNRPSITQALRGCLQSCSQNPDNCAAGLTCKPYKCPPGVSCTNELKCQPDVPNDPRCPIVTNTPTPTPAGCNQPCVRDENCRSGYRCDNRRCVPSNPIVKCPPVTIPPITIPPVTVPPVTIPISFPPITQTPECRTDLQCGGVSNIQCPPNYDCIRARGNPSIIGLCRSRDPKCEQLTLGPTINVSLNPTFAPVKAKIRGNIVVNSCKKPTNVTTVICPKNDKDPNHCFERAAPVSFIGQDPTNPNKWIYSYEHTEAPISGLTRNEPIERGVLYENLQAFAQYEAEGLIHDSGIVTFPANQARTGARQAYAYILPTENEAVINYEVPQNALVCPPTSVTPSLSPTPTSGIPSITPIASNTPTPGICEYSAIVEIQDKDTHKPIPLSQVGNPAKWGVANDAQYPKPYNVFSLYGDIVNGERVTRYVYKTPPPAKGLTFRGFPDFDSKALYFKGDQAYVNVFIDTDKWELVEKIPCKGQGCPASPIAKDSKPIEQYGDKTNGFNIDCGTKVGYGWVVKKRPDNKPKACVLRDTENAARCTPKNVRADRISRSTVKVNWNSPESSCDFRAGNNGDHYKVDIVDMTEDPSKVITSCDNITRTQSECTLDVTYNPNSSKTRGNFKRGHTYNVNVYAVKEIPGASDICASINGKDFFEQPVKDSNDKTPPENPEPTAPPLGFDVKTRQIDWIREDNTGVAWGAWSHGSCALTYNGTDWARSINDPKIMYKSPENPQEVTVGLVPEEKDTFMNLRPQVVECNACVTAADGRRSQCDASFPGARVRTGGNVKVESGKCYTTNADLAVTDAACGTPDGTSKQPEPPKKGEPQPQPTTSPRTPTSSQPGTTTAPVDRSKVTVKVAYTIQKGEEKYRIYPTLEEIDGATGNLKRTLVPAPFGGLTTGEHTTLLEHTFTGISDLNNYKVDVYFTDASGKKLTENRFTSVAFVRDQCSEVIKRDSRDICSFHDGGGEVTYSISTNGSIALSPTPKNNPAPTNKPIDNKSILLFSNADTYVSAKEFSANNGSKDYLAVGYATVGGFADKPNILTSYVSFDLNNVKNKIITKAEIDLSVDVNLVKPGKIFNILATYNNPTPALRSIENSMTYISRLNSIVPAGSATVDSKTRRLIIDLDPEVVTLYANDPSKFNGFMLAEDEGSDHSAGFIYFDSRESNNNPKLYLEFGNGSSSVAQVRGSTVAINNSASQSISSISIAQCNNVNKCSVENLSLGIAAGASTKFKPSFSIASDTQRLSCVVTYSNGSRKQCAPQLVSQNSGDLQFNISAQPDGSVRTAIISPLKNADTNGDCTVTAADGAGLRDLDGSGSVNAADTSLFLSFLGQNACR